jgi:hypothetical protein
MIINNMDSDISSRQGTIATKILAFTITGTALLAWDGCATYVAARHVIDGKDRKGAINYAREILERSDTLWEQIYFAGEIRAAQNYLREHSIHNCARCKQ